MSKHRKKKVRKYLVTLAAVMAAFFVLTACGSYNDERGKGDAPVAGKQGDDSPKTVTNNPDGFGNVATGCVAGAEGYRYFVTTNTSGPSHLVVLEDPECGVPQARYAPAGAR